MNENCTACGDCCAAVETMVDDPFNYNLGQHKAAYLPNAMAYPQRYVLDPAIIGTPDADRAKAACKYGAIDLDMQEETIQVKAGAVVWATGWQPYDAAKIQPLRLWPLQERHHQRRIRATGRHPRPHRRQDPASRRRQGSEEHRLHPVRRFARREPSAPLFAHLLHGLAEADPLRARKYPEDGKSTIYYIDIRAIDRFEDFYQKVQADPSVSFIKSKVAKITEDEHGNPVCHGVDTEGYKRYTTPHDLVVLAVGMEPSVKGVNIPGHVVADSSGFIEADPANGAVFGAGCASNALDVNRAVQSATAAALRAIQVVNKVAKAEA